MSDVKPSATEGNPSWSEDAMDILKMKIGLVKKDNTEYTGRIAAADKVSDKNHTDIVKNKGFDKFKMFLKYLMLYLQI